MKNSGMDASYREGQEFKCLVQVLRQFKSSDVFWTSQQLIHRYEYQQGLLLWYFLVS